MVDYVKPLRRLLARRVAGAPQIDAIGIDRRIHPAIRIRRRNRRSIGEEILEYVDPITQIHCLVVIGVGGVQAGRYVFLTGIAVRIKQITQHTNSVGDVENAWALRAITFLKRE